VIGKDGKPAYARPEAGETGNVHAIAYGIDKKTDELKIALIDQARPHANNVFEPDSKENVVFRQIPMGFLDNLIGIQLEPAVGAGESGGVGEETRVLESPVAGAIRELGEETGLEATAIKRIWFPMYDEHWANPTFMSTTSHIVFVEVDLEKINEMKTDRNEPIFRAEYVPLEEVLEDIRLGKTERGYARMATSNSALLIFLSHLTAFQAAPFYDKADRKRRKMRIEKLQQPEKRKSMKDHVKNQIKGLE